jgi:LysR family hydrogen peroxide-inducible transcriptional activator
MEVHQLRYVAAVARAGNFSRAAELCHVSQPSLSQQILKLEDELGEKLFERLRRRARLTEAGKAFLPRAQRILSELELALREAKEGREGVRGSLIIGALPTIAPYLLPRVLRTFIEKHPGVHLVVREEMTSRLVQLASNCDLDLFLASLPVEDARLEQETLFNEELLLAVPPGNALGKLPQVSVAEVAREPFILLKEGHCLGDQVLDFCRRRDFQPRISCRSAQMETIRALVMAGLGISVVPKMAAREGAGDQVLYRSFKGPRPSRSITAFWPKQRPLSRAATAFLEELRKV